MPVVKCDGPEFCHIGLTKTKSNYLVGNYNVHPLCCGLGLIGANILGLWNCKHLK